MVITKLWYVLSSYSEELYVAYVTPIKLLQNW